MQSFSLSLEGLQIIINNNFNYRYCCLLPSFTTWSFWTRCAEASIASWAQILWHCINPLYSSDPSQQSARKKVRTNPSQLKGFLPQMPSFTIDEGIVFERNPLLTQKNLPEEHAEVPGKHRGHHKPPIDKMVYQAHRFHPGNRRSCHWLVSSESLLRRSGSSHLHTSAWEMTSTAGRLRYPQSVWDGPDPLPREASLLRSEKETKHRDTRTGLHIRPVHICMDKVMAMMTFIFTFKSWTLSRSQPLSRAWFEEFNVHVQGHTTSSYRQRMRRMLLLLHNGCPSTSLSLEKMKSVTSLRERG